MTEKTPGQRRESRWLSMTETGVVRLSGIASVFSPTPTQATQIARDWPTLRGHHRRRYVRELAAVCVVERLNPEELRVVSDRLTIVLDQCQRMGWQ